MLLFADYKLLLFDRIAKIQSIINKHNIANFYLSFSGGKDSTILHYLIDMALPDNKIPRVFINTGIEYIDIVNFVKELQIKDDRFIIIAPSKNIKQTLKKYGYPFKSKQHSHNLSIFQNSGNTTTINKYLNTKESRYKCPNILRYQFKKSFNIKISDKCCLELKKKPISKWQKETAKTITITGMRKDEGGNRNNLNCIVTDKNDNIIKFHPLAVVSDKWEDWFVGKYNIDLCKLYYSPFNFKRTGCKGCPFSLDLQEQLSIMEVYLPNERKQCENIWKTIYSEYRRIDYRLEFNEQLRLF